MAGVRGGVSEVVLMKGGGITGGGSSSVTPFMLQNLTKSLSESTERAEHRGGRGRARVVKPEALVDREQEREKERVRLLQQQQQQQQRIEAERERRDGVVVCKERSGGVQWKYVCKSGEKSMQVMHAKQHRDPVAVGLELLKSCVNRIFDRVRHPRGCD